MDALVIALKKLYDQYADCAARHSLLVEYLKTQGDNNGR